MTHISKPKKQYKNPAPVMLFTAFKCGRYTVHEKLQRTKLEAQQQKKSINKKDPDFKTKEIQ